MDNESQIPVRHRREAAVIIPHELPEEYGAQHQNRKLSVSYGKGSAVESYFTSSFGLDF